jgi:uncharacterized protein DUF4340
MKNTGLLIAAAVLAALSGVLYWSNHHKPAGDTTVKASPDAAPKILTLNQPDITAVAIHRQDQPRVDLSRDSSGKWQITAPKPLAADQEDVSSMLSTLSSLSSDRLLEEKTSDLSPYGLANPDVEVDVTLKDNKTQKLLIGAQTPSGNNYYAMLSGDPRLFTIATYSKTSLDKSTNDLRDKRLLTADFDKVSQIELLNQKPDKKADITFARNKDAWQILKPKPARADSDEVEGLIRSLRDAKMDVSATTDESKVDAGFKSAKPFAAVKVTGTSGTQELEIRKAKDDYYAKSSVVPGVFKVATSVGTSLDKGLDDFRNKKLFDFGYSDPNKIEIHDGAKSHFLLHSGSDWWGPDGKKLDEMSSQDLVSKVRDLSANKFPDSGFTTPALELTVTSNDNKRVENVSISKKGDTYIAKRENEPELYELPAASVTALQQAAADLKPAVPPTPTSPPAPKK